MADEDREVRGWLTKTAEPDQLAGRTRKETKRKNLEVQHKKSASSRRHKGKGREKHEQLQ